MADYVLEVSQPVAPAVHAIEPILAAIVANLETKISALTTAFQDDNKIPSPPMHVGEGGRSRTIFT